MSEPNRLNRSASEMHAENPARQQPTRCPEHVMNRCRPFHCEHRHIQCALAEADDHDTFACEDRKIDDIPLGHDTSMEPTLVVEQRSLLAFGVLPCGYHDAIEA